MNIVIMRWLCLMYATLLSTRLLKNDKVVDVVRETFGINIYNNGFTLLGTPSTIVLCSSSEDLMNVSTVVISPDPPKKGQNLTVSINGVLSEPLNEGSYLMAKVRKGSIRFPQVRLPACDYIVGGCPVSQDVKCIDMVFEIPKFVPGGAYEIEAILYNAEPNVAGNLFLIRWFTSSQQGLTDKIQLLEDGKRTACIQGSLELT